MRGASPRQLLLQGLFDQLYTRFAWGYDVAALVAGAGLWYRWVEQALPLVERGPVLEIGFGRGHLLPLLRARGLTAIGLDASAQMVRHVAPRHRAVVQGVAQALPFARDTFATLITTFPAPFVVAEASQREFARLLRPDGVWFWVDAPRFAETQELSSRRISTLPSALLSRALHAPASDEDPRTMMPLVDWQATAHRRQVGPSTIGVWEMRP